MNDKFPNSERGSVRLSDQGNSIQVSDKRLNAFFVVLRRALKLILAWLDDNITSA